MRAKRSYLVDRVCKGGFEAYVNSRAHSRKGGPWQLADNRIRA